MRQTLDVVNRMEAEGLLGRYAIAGAVAAYNYIEASLTEDLDLLIAVDHVRGSSSVGLVTLTQIFSYLAERGYREFRHEGIVIEGWPVQFLPIADALDYESLERAESVTIRFEGDTEVRTRVLRAEHLVAGALKIGRPKDFVRITQFLSENAVDLGALQDVIVRHELTAKWGDFCGSAGLSRYVDFLGDEA